MTDEHGIPPYQITLFRSLDAVLAPFEQVSASAGDASRLFLLTSNGRILIVDRELGVSAEARLPQVKAAPLDFASACFYSGSTGVLVALHRGFLAFVNVDGNNEVLYTRREVRMVSLNASGTQTAWPNHEYAYVAGKNQISLCHLIEGTEKVLWKHRPDSPVTALCFEGTALCFTTQTGCFVLDITSVSDAGPTLAFPLEWTAGSCPPAIAHISESEFCIAGALAGGMALFVDGSGAAARPPLVFHTEGAVRALKSNDKIIYVLTDDELMLFDNAHAGSMRQAITLPTPIALLTIIGSTGILFARPPKADVYHVTEIDWVQKASDLVDGGKFESALEVLDAHEAENEAQIMTVSSLLIRIGLHYLKEGEAEKGAELLLLGKPSANDITSAYSAIFENEDSNDDKYSDVVLVSELIEKILLEEWSEAEAKTWSTLLLLLSLRKCETPKEMRSCLAATRHYDFARARAYFEGRKKHNVLLALLMDDARRGNKDVSSILTLDWIDPAYRHSIDRLTLLEYLKMLPPSSNALFEGWFDFLCEREEGKGQLLAFIQSAPTRFDTNRVVELLRDEREIAHKVLWQNYAAGCRKESVVSTLTEIIMGKIIALHLRVQEDDEDEEENSDEEHLLRHELLTLMLNNTRDVVPDPLLKDKDLFWIELDVIRDSITRIFNPRQSPLILIRGILGRMESPFALSAIDTIVLHFKAAFPALPLDFIRSLKEKCDADPIAAMEHRIPELMRGLIFSSPELVDSLGSVDEVIPETASLSTFSPVLERELLAAREKRQRSIVSRALQEATRTKSDDLALAHVRVELDEKSRCDACGKGFAQAMARPIHRLPNGLVIHGSCHPHINICPVTNQLFRAT